MNEILDDQLTFRGTPTLNDIDNVVSLKKSIALDNFQIKWAFNTMVIVTILKGIASIVEIASIKKEEMEFFYDMSWIYYTIGIILTLYIAGILLYFYDQLAGIIFYLTVFVLVELIIIYGDPTLILRGMLTRVIVIIFLARGISSAYSMKKNISLMNFYQIRN
ncbi:MAG TPA: hypothetical protein PK147_05075 [Saprospiraceae bacterium]|nr:hypothetical protein [Lewinellaceae bacterium]HPK08719.1 hypothetical protein [Saprospiraceae bacterium]HPQ21199.1 hypothetical protein [Saprospiraceae bacterium]